MDRAAVAGLGLGLGLYLLPFTWALPAAFFVTIAFIFLHTITSHTR
jgi:hypothetical protein